MAGKMGPSEVFHHDADEVADSLTELRVEEIQAEVTEPEDQDAQHFYVTVEASEESGGHEDDMMSNMDGLPMEQPTSITTLLSLPEVTVSRRQRRAEPHVDYSKSIILTSDTYITLMEEKCARKEASEKAKAEKKQQREADKKRRDEEKLKEQENKRERELARARKKAFDQSWSPAAVAAYGQCLHDRIRSGEPLPPNSFRPPFLGFPPEICRENQRLAIKRRRAKRRKEDVSNLPPLTSPHWAHKPGAPLWSRIQSQEGHDPRMLTTPQGAKQFFMRPYEDISQSSEPAMHLLVRRRLTDSH